MKLKINRQNIKILNTRLQAREDDPRLQGEKLIAEGGILTPQEAKFLEFWQTLSFTAHHATEYLSQIKRQGALTTVHERLAAGTLEAAHTGGLERQEYLYFTIGLGGKFKIPLFIGENPAVITLPMHCFYKRDQYDKGTKYDKDHKEIKFDKATEHKLNKQHALLVEHISLNNHDHWFTEAEQTDPIEINGIVRYIQFHKNRTKTYHYHDTNDDRRWERTVTALEETFFAIDNCSLLLHVLGLQFLLELYEFGGELRQRILQNPEQHRQQIIYLFQELFPSEIYPELRIKGNIPLQLSGISIKEPDDKTQNKINQLHAAISEKDLKKATQLLDDGTPLDGVAICESYCCNSPFMSKQLKHLNTPLIAAFRHGAIEIGRELTNRGANLQTLSLNHPEHLLMVMSNPFASLDSLDRLQGILTLLKGLQSSQLPELKHHFSLSRSKTSIHHVSGDNLFHVTIAQILLICFPPYQNSESQQEMKQKILAEMEKSSPKEKEFLQSIIAGIEIQMKEEEQEEVKMERERESKLRQEILRELKKKLPYYETTGLLATVCMDNNYFSASLDTRPLNWLLEQKCDINLPIPSQNNSHILNIAADKGMIDILEWAFNNGAKLFMPSDSQISPLLIATTKCQIAAIKWFLTKKPLSTFSKEDLEIVARNIDSFTKAIELEADKDLTELTRYSYNIVKEKVKEITNLFMEDKRSKDIFEEVASYSHYDNAVGAVVYTEINQKKYVLLMVRSEDALMDKRFISYCGPGGVVDINETPRKAIFREIFEETQLAIDEKKSTVTSVYMDEKFPEEKYHLKRALYGIRLNGLSDLPIISPHDDAYSVEWVNIDELKIKEDGRMYYHGCPLWHSNALLIQKLLFEQPIPNPNFAKALYFESQLAQSIFIDSILDKNLKKITKWIADGIAINTGGAMLIAMQIRDESILRLLIEAGGNINKMNPAGENFITQIYKEMELPQGPESDSKDSGESKSNELSISLQILQSSLSTFDDLLESSPYQNKEENQEDEMEQKDSDMTEEEPVPTDEAKPLTPEEGFAWLEKLITDFGAEWTKGIVPERSLLYQLLKDRHSHFLIRLIDRRLPPFSSFIFNFCFKQAITFKLTAVLDALARNYPGLTKQALADMSLLEHAALTSITCFEWMLQNGSKVSKELLAQIKLADPRLPENEEKQKELILSRQPIPITVMYFNKIIKLIEENLKHEQDKNSLPILQKMSLTTTASEEKTDLDSSSRSTTTSEVSTTMSLG